MKNSINRVKLIDLLQSKAEKEIQYNKPFNCIFHADKTPSAVVYQNGLREYFICFSCGVKGGLFNILEHTHGIYNYEEKVKFLRSLK